MKMEFKKVFVSLAATVVGTLSAFAAPPDSTLLLIKDDPIVATLDSLASSKIMNSADFCPGFVVAGDDTAPYFDEATYRKRLAKLDAQSPFDLVYNDAVRGYIDLYAVKKRKVSAKMLGLAQHYFPMFEEKLSQFNLPLELKYLSIVESALNPSIRSRVGATGLWQFMYATGKIYNLNTTSYVDDRCDPYKSTIAACRYFTYLYSLYKDWSLVLAAYNSGPGNVNKAIRRSGGKMTYWEIRPYLPQETQGYVPAFIAVNYVMNYADEHNLTAIVPPINNLDLDTVHVKHEITFKQLSDMLDIPYENLRYWNPSYLLGVIPYTGEPSTLVLPRKDVASFINNEKAIYEYADRSKPSRSASAINSVNNSGKPTSTTNNGLASVGNVSKYVVKKGDNIAIIAKKMNVTTTQIRKWNGLKSNAVYKGQKLTIKSTAPVVKEEAPKTSTEPEKTPTTTTTTPEKTTPAKAPVKTTTTATTAGKTSYYTVRSGDSLYAIATKYKVNYLDIKKWNNLKSNNLVVGQKLKIVGK